MKKDPVFQPDDDAFDLRMRAEFSRAFDAEDPPAHLLRQTSRAKRHALHGLVATLILTAGISATVLTLRPPDLVRHAIDHEYSERTLRGIYLDEQTLHRQLGLAPADAIPGSPQLIRLCDIDGQRAYHLTTYLEKGGMVSVFAFVKPIPLQERSGWWGNVHWRVITSRDGKPLLLIAEQKQALAVARNSLLPSSA